MLDCVPFTINLRYQKRKKTNLPDLLSDFFICVDIYRVSLSSTVFNCINIIALSEKYFCLIKL